MAERLGRRTVRLEKEPKIVCSAAVVGKKEGEGPMGGEFDLVIEDTSMGEKSWEKAESQILHKAVVTALEKGGFSPGDMDAVFSGDLLNQCMSSCFGLRDFNIPFAGVYGACSTMALSLCMASLAIESGAFKRVIAATSSHFCSAEKQFRYPLEYAGQRPPVSQWTVTGSGAAVLSTEGRAPYIDCIHLGTICDMGIVDMNNMGAAMAPVSVKLRPYPIPKT